ncbi:MAG: DUF4124 domain-containing protein [Desulfobacteraceae bacterium]|nr:MAG: DUF4124 domain-containing protein [Desulfobacteraceae bacterium]
MKTAAFLAIIMLTGFTPAAAEFYRYVDQHGNILYTDDLNNVPADRRGTVQSYEEAPNAVSPEQNPPESKPDSAGNTMEAMENERKQLEQQEKDLNKEYDELVKRRGELDQEKEKAVTADHIKSYNQQITDFNARVRAYEEKRGIHTSKVNTFNNRLKENPGEPERK